MIDSVRIRPAQGYEDGRTYLCHAGSKKALGIQVGNARRFWRFGRATGEGEDRVFFFKTILMRRVEGRTDYPMAG